MKFLFKNLMIFALIFLSCKTEKKEISKEISKEVSKTDYQFIGNEITVGEPLTAAEMLKKFKTLKVGDTIYAKFASRVKEVCTKKGCWMKLPLDNNTETMVRFKDYSFFMPLDSKDKEVIINGVAFVKETSVKELQHYAEDAGKSKEEIAKITKPKKEFAFTANGVLLR